MWCGCYAAEELTGWTKTQVWLHVRALWERRGRRFRDKPYGGIPTMDILSAIERAGFTATEVFHDRRIRYGDFVRRYPDGNYLMLQNRHLFAHVRGQRPAELDAERAVIVAAWRISRRTLGEQVAKE